MRFVLLFLLLSSPLTFAAPPEKTIDENGKKSLVRIMFCHYEEAEDEEDETLETGETLDTGEGELELKNLPVKAALKHLDNHPKDTIELMVWAIDADGDGFHVEGTDVPGCVSPGEDYILIGPGSETDPDDTDPEVPLATVQ